MIYKVWRQAHLWLAAVSSLVLIPVAITGVILGISFASRQTNVSGIEPGWQDITLGELLPQLEEHYLELTSLEVSAVGGLSLQAIDEAGESVHVQIHPRTGEALGEAHTNSPFIAWVLTLHRSLFMHEAGRIVVGVATFLLLLILLTGLVLLYRQNGWRGLLYRSDAPTVWSKWHSILGRLLLVPLVASALTGTFLFMKRMQLLPEGSAEIKAVTTTVVDASADPIAYASLIPQIAEAKLGDLRKLDFPLWLGDASDVYTLQYKTRQMTFSAMDGSVLREEIFPLATVFSTQMLDWHTGRTNIGWAILLSLGSLGVVFFILSGFVMLYQRVRLGRRKSTIASSSEAEIVLLYGSEHGTTLRFAEGVAEQWRASGHGVHLASLDEYTNFAGCRYLVVFTCTYGDGVAPSNAQHLEARIRAYAQTNNIAYSVVAFGSSKYPAFCAYGEAVDQWLASTPHFTRLLPLHRIDNRSRASLVAWASAWSTATVIHLSTDEDDYQYSRH